MSSPNGLSDRILIVGDETKSVQAIQRLLAASGYDAISHSSFDSARDELRSREVSLIIIESSASRITGSTLLPSIDDTGESLQRLNWAQLSLDFCEEVRTGQPTADVPILMISKSQRAQDKVACLNQGATDYITRPYQRAELLSRVRVHLRSSRYEREKAERFEQLNVLHTVSSVLASSLEPEVLLQGTLSALMKYVGADSGVVFLREADERPMTIAAVEGLTVTDEVRGSLLELYSRIVPLNGKPLVLEPLPESARRVLAVDPLSEVRGLACTQLVLKGKRWARSACSRFQVRIFPNSIPMSFRPFAIN